MMSALMLHTHTEVDHLMQDSTLLRWDISHHRMVLRPLELVLNPSVIKEHTSGKQVKPCA